MKAKTLRESCLEWERKTWLESIPLVKNPNEKLEELLNDLKITNKKVTGESVMGLERTAEGGIPKNINYSNIFFRLCHEDEAPHPIEYISTICDEFTKWKQKTPKGKSVMSGVCARGLRTLASLFRDLDFKEQLQEEIVNSKILRDSKILTGKDLDAREHTDILVECAGRKFRIWLFQLSDNGIVNTTDRILGNRGALPSGTHILCGVDTEDPTQIENFADWYFYSKSKMVACLKEMENVISNQIMAADYSKVCRILQAPKALLFNITSFKI